MKRQQKVAAEALFREMLIVFRPDRIMFWQVAAGYGTNFHRIADEFEIPYIGYVANMEYDLYLSVPWRWILFFRGRPYLADLLAMWNSIRTGHRREYHAVKWEQIAFCSEFMRSKHEQAGFPVQKSQVIHWGIDAAEATVVMKRTVDEPLRILWAGRLVYEKGLHVLLDALQNISIDYRLDVYAYLGFAGQWEYVETIRKRVATDVGLAERVRLLDHVDSETLRRMMPKYDVFVLSSIWEEPFSVALLEAAAAGLALVATTTGGTPEADPKKERVMMYEPNHVHTLRAHLERLGKDRRFLCERQAAALDVARHFSLDHMSQRLFELLEKAK